MNTHYKRGKCNRQTFAKISCKVGRGRQPYRGALASRDKILPVLENFRWILATPGTRSNPNSMRNKIYVPHRAERSRKVEIDIYQRRTMVEGKPNAFSHIGGEGDVKCGGKDQQQWSDGHKQCFLPRFASYFERGSEKGFQHLDKSVDASAL